MAKEYLDKTGLAYFWGKIKDYVDTAVAGGGGGGGASPSTTTPTMNGTAAVGTETAYSRGDHVHPTDTSRAPIDNPEFTTRVTSPIFRVTGHTTAIGATLSASNSAAVSLTATTAKTGASISLPVGTWVVVCTVNLPQPSANQYIRMAFRTDANSNANEAQYHYTSKALVKPQLVKIVTVSTAATYYFSLYCSVAASVAAGNATISAVRIA